MDQSTVVAIWNSTLIHSVLTVAFPRAWQKVHLWQTFQFVCSWWSRTYEISHTVGKNTFGTKQIQSWVWNLKLTSTICSAQFLYLVILGALMVSTCAFCRKSSCRSILKYYLQKVMIITIEYFYLEINRNILAWGYSTENNTIFSNSLYCFPISQKKFISQTLKKKTPMFKLVCTGIKNILSSEV